MAFMERTVFPASYFGSADAKVLSREAALAALAPYKRHLRVFIETLPVGARVLDIGCGQGKALKLALALRPDLAAFGMDSADMSAHFPPNVAFTQGSLENLASLYAGERFDAVICQHVIEHLISPLALMEGIGAVLKEGGRLYLETPNWTRLIAPFSHLYFYNDYTHIRPFSRAAMTRLLLDHGYADLAIRTVSSCAWFPKRGTGARLEEEATSGVAQKSQGIVSRIFARLLNPLLRDVLIATAVRHERS